MTSLRDIFSNAFTGNSGGNNSNNGGSSNNMTYNGRNRPYRENGRATNLTETNNGIARQSNFVDEVIALNQQQRHPQYPSRGFFPSNPVNETISKHQVTLTDEIVMDLTRGLNNLTVTQRQEAQNDMYGIFGTRNRNEDPWELNMWMNEMDDVIRKGISGNDKRFSALRLAMHSHGKNNGSSMSGAEYVGSQKLKFLRASDWVVEAGVARMALFFELKLEYFGSDALIRDLSMDDLTAEDIDLWKRYGFLQLSEEQDAYGRAIMVFIMKEQFHLPHSTVIRCLLYLSTVMTWDESLQLAGNVQLFWTNGQEFAVGARARLVIQAYKALPLRGVARHVCYDSKGAVQDLFGLIAQIVQPWATIRLKLHSGTMMECFYNLMTYGIPRSATPINNEGEVELNFHISFLEAIERKEADEQKRRRQERLDNQIQQMQLHNQMIFNNTMENSGGNEGVSDSRGEPYQREPPTIPMDEGPNNSDRSSLLSWNMAGLAGMDPFSLRSEEMESLPDSFLKQLTSGGNSASTSTRSQTDMTLSSANNLPLHRQTTIQSGTASKFPSVPMPMTLASNSSSIRSQQVEVEKDELILVPGVYDVIMGRGRHNKKKPGNRKLNALLEAYQEEYERSDKFQKTVLSEVVVSKMIEDGSRFLVREGEKKHGVWVEVSLEKARDKVAHDFRNLRRSAKMAQKNPTASDVSISDAPTFPSPLESGAGKRQRSLGNTLEHGSKASRQV